MPEVASSNQPPISSELAKLLMPNEGNQEQNWLLFKEILDSRKHLETTLLQLLYSATLKEDEQTTDVPDGAGGTRQRRRPFVRIARLPDESKICPECKEIRDDYKWASCDNIKLHKNKQKVPTAWLNWKPLLNDVGFTSVTQAVLTNVNVILSTANMDKGFKGINYGLGIGADIDEMIYEHPEWQGEGAKFTRSFRTLLESTVALNVASVLSRSLEGRLIDRITQSTQVRETLVRGLGEGRQKSEGGMLSKIGQWFTQ